MMTIDFIITQKLFLCQIKILSIIFAQDFRIYQLRFYRQIYYLPRLERINKFLEIRVNSFKIHELIIIIIYISITLKEILQNLSFRSKKHAKQICGNS